MLENNCMIVGVKLISGTWHQDYADSYIDILNILRHEFYLKLPLYFKHCISCKSTKYIFEKLNFVKWLLNDCVVMYIRNLFLTIRCTSLIKTYGSNALVCNHQYHHFIFVHLKTTIKTLCLFSMISSCIRIIQIMIHNILGKTWFSRGRGRLGFFLNILFGIKKIHS